MIASDLDDWVAGVGSALNLLGTRDPDLVFPPCVYAELPAVTALSLSAVQVELPVWLIATGAGKTAFDPLLDLIPDFLAATDKRTANPGGLSIGGQEFAGYTVTVTLALQLDTPPILSDQPDPSTSEEPA
jgi:hypothetical protein